ncbi:type II toxin-antitoxin system PemK/MazF family toxin [Natronomonas marina]|uniref:type II toxin-antitoxin system PemK/MazF family toxin n=1 Tax=Natronomonas marina TaxID=2961939 RepID=UPI0020CA0CAE|nr:type II toxin-antitoxin system PemK/MazF family toxin [Natronomonas marina]
MAYAQGSVVLAPASFRGGRRPYLVVSNEDRPFFGEEYTVAVITTTVREAAVEVTAESFVEGRLDRYPSYRNSRRKPRASARG